MKTATHAMEMRLPKTLKRFAYMIESISDERTSGNPFFVYLRSDYKSVTNECQTIAEYTLSALYTELASRVAWACEGMSGNVKTTHKSNGIAIEMEINEMAEMAEAITPKVKKAKKEKDTYIKVVGSAPKAMIQSEQGHTTLAYKVSQKAKRKGKYTIVKSDRDAMVALYEAHGSVMVTMPEFNNYARTIIYSAMNSHFAMTGFEINRDYHEDLMHDTLALILEAFYSNQRYSINTYDEDGNTLKDEEGKNIKQDKALVECTQWNEAHNLCFSRALQSISELFRSLCGAKAQTDSDHESAVLSYTTDTTDLATDINAVLRKHLTAEQYATWLTIADKERNGVALSTSEYKVKSRIVKRMQNRLETNQVTATELYR